MAPAQIDAWLLTAFPGRTLDELDRMDFPRWMRAREVVELDRIEQLNLDYLAKRAKPSTAEWRKIRQHNNWWREYQALHPRADNNEDEDEDA